MRLAGCHPRQILVWVRQAGPLMAGIVMLTWLSPLSVTKGTIVVGKGIGGVDLGMSPNQVRRILGTPNRTVHADPYYAPQLEYIYPHELVIFHGEDAVTSVSTTSSFERTVDDIGVGSTRAAVAARVPRIRCDRDPGRPCYVGSRRPGGVLTQFDFSGNGRVSQVFIGLVTD